MDSTAITRGNAAFVSTGAYRGLAMAPRRRLVVVGCADPRVNPEQILGLQLGDAAVIRTIGGRVTPSVLATLAGLARLGARAAQASAGRGDPPGTDLLVLHHTDCGIVRLVDEPDALAGFLGVDPARLDAMAVADPHRAVAHDVSVLRGLAMPGLRVWGLVHDVATGVVRIVAAPEEAAA